MFGCIPAVCDDLIGKTGSGGDMGTQAGSDSLQRIMDRPHMQFAINNPQQHRVTIHESQRAPDLGWYLQPAATHQFAALSVHV
jgi:hypothetical protein